MDIQSQWEKAVKGTQLLRPRIKGLSAVAETRLPYIFMAESAVNRGDTVLRRGAVTVDRPALLLPPNSPQFEGFDFEKDLAFGSETLTNFLLVRGVAFPSFKYQNETYELDLYEGKLSDCEKKTLNQLARVEDVETGCFVGPEDCWQLSVLIYVCMQVARSAGNDIKHILEEYNKRRDA